ncbi:MAG: anhydro-N-acetylmuramic acid kinase [Pseudomonadota bacterium]
MADLYVGTICGTSLDGIDVALVDFPDDATATVLQYDSMPLEPSLARALGRIVFDGADCSLKDFGTLDQRIGIAIADAVNTLLERGNYRARDIVGIGTHGINVRHAPNDPHPHTLQIGDPNQIAYRTGITTVADFRRADVARGGQGAPLAPAFHQAVFAADEPRVVMNLGGIANITVLIPGTPPIGFDTGPANGLLDAWFVSHHADRQPSATFDRDGSWAASGTVDPTLLQRLLNDAYFLQPAPKSTGKEYFNLQWLNAAIGSQTIEPRDVQATLAALTAQSVCEAIERYSNGARSVLVCGGGAHNTHLVEQIASMLQGATVNTTAPFGVAPDEVEAAAFAWLAKQTLANHPGNLPSVTGANQNAILGGVYSVG